MTILRAHNLSKTYGAKKHFNSFVALKNISFEVIEGEFIGVMGASGSGKTTLLNILGSIDKPTSGKIIINDKDVSTLKKDDLAKHRIDNIGFIFQDFNLLETMTLKENIILPLSLNGYKVNVIEKRVEKLASDLNITDILCKYPYEVSGGEQQRAAACRALIAKPKIILADEPTGNLDSKSSENLLELLTFINKEYKATILMVTHDVFAASYCKRIIFIRDGQLHNEIYAGNDKKKFFDSILEVMSVLGGENK